MNKDKRERIRKAYFSPNGMGLFDIIPVIRDLPFKVRFLLLFITLTVIIFGLFGFLGSLLIALFE